MKLKTFLAIPAALMLMAAAALASVNTDYDHNANFANYKTFSFGKIEAPDSIWEQRIKDAVSSQLAARGLTEVSTGGDVMVNAFSKTQPERTLNTFYDGFGGGWRWRGFGGTGESTTTVETYNVGTLVVDMFDANGKNLLWRGVSSDTLSNSADKNTKKLDGDVHKMFQHFPPAASSK